MLHRTSRIEEQRDQWGSSELSMVEWRFLINECLELTLAIQIYIYTVYTDLYSNSERGQLDDVGFMEPRQ